MGGLLMGVSACFGGAFLGSFTAFILGRYIFKEQVSKFSSKYRLFKALDRTMMTGGLKMTFLMRLTPLIPYILLNYLLALTKISMRDFCLGTFGLLPVNLSLCSLAPLSQTSKTPLLVITRVVLD